MTRFAVGTENPVENGRSSSRKFRGLRSGQRWVSTDEQTPDNQLQELRAGAERMGWLVAAEYIDHGISGAKGRDRRPAYDRLYGTIVRREIDLVMER